jgi:two-component system, sensor histidine kinase and response regulator
MSSGSGKKDKQDEMDKKPILLIVDDEERNIRLLKAMLMARNFDLREATQGEEALRIVSETSPDLILLDVMMPRMDGFEVCRRLKQDEKTKVIPIIMVTALAEKQHRLKALEVGADDFISKPVDHMELTVRVKSLLRIKSYQDELQNHLREIVSKNAKLEELEKTRDGLAHMIIHDLRNPLTAISTYTQLLMMGEDASEDQKPKMERCLYYCKELDRMIQNLLDIGRMEEGKLTLQREVTDIRSLFDEVSDHFRIEGEERKISLEFCQDEIVPAVSIDRDLMKRVLANLLNNALRHTPKGGKIEISTVLSPNLEDLCIAVRDTGVGLPPEYHQKIFDKFEQVQLKSEKGVGGSSGLGLTFCKMAVEAHGGKIWVESEGTGKGCTFCVQIPVSPQGET